MGGGSTSECLLKDTEFPVLDSIPWKHLENLDNLENLENLDKLNNLDNLLVRF